ncbi:1-acyl-sn-glycerol-3-phosphate acyltransferase [Treponema brennaborense]|uniref:Phospholipid/glycerol acyltransferase n=1 Tax=Treponema brennaborense (strain DSM 12168 / CIP 105900 / DD5/3) TaxID=906968 RepID=F4LP50_TREBD|nr:1-acyl-sn-glycerol-3-phosphate acyltransferase [Treponema brennaborense]AEE15926.1 phospholipid/glycerol acyltransferase [Treponema brennaborense DSM 12168]
MERETFYYTDELNDEFSGIKRNTVTVDHSYTYLHTDFRWKILSFIVYRIVMTPIAYLYLKCKFHLRIENRQVLKQGKKESYFLIGNHTQVPGDGYIPTVLTFPKKDAVIVNADNVSLPGTQTFMAMIGAVPLPNRLSGMRNFMTYMKYLAEDNQGIAIYPEAHIWPYYTGIRPFKSDAFRYPILFGKKVFCFTTTYRKRKFGRKPAITVYVDGPFEADSSVGKKEAEQKLRDQVYNIMVERSKNSTYEYIIYRKAPLPR